MAIVRVTNIITLETAVKILRFVEDQVLPRGWHAALTGSSIFSGYSNDDVDIVLYPHNADEFQDIAKVWDKLINAHKCESKYRDSKPVYSIQLEGFLPLPVKVDLFVLYPPYTTKALTED